MKSSIRNTAFLGTIKESIPADDLEFLEKHLHSGTQVHSNELLARLISIEWFHEKTSAPKLTEQLRDHTVAQHSSDHMARNTYLVLTEIVSGGRQLVLNEFLKLHKKHEKSLIPATIPLLIQSLGKKHQNPELVWELLSEASSRLLMENPDWSRYIPPDLAEGGSSERILELFEDASIQDKEAYVRWLCKQESPEYGWAQMVLENSPSKQRVRLAKELVLQQEPSITMLIHEKLIEYSSAESGTPRIGNKWMSQLSSRTWKSEEEAVQQILTFICWSQSGFLRDHYQGLNGISQLIQKGERPSDWLYAFLHSAMLSRDEELTAHLLKLWLRRYPKMSLRVDDIKGIAEVCHAENFQIFAIFLFKRDPSFLSNELFNTWIESNHLPWNSAMTKLVCEELIEFLTGRFTLKKGHWDLHTLLQKMAHLAPIQDEYSIRKKLESIQSYWQTMANELEQLYSILALRQKMHSLFA